MRIAIIGFGCEGKSLLAYLKKLSECRGANIEILDKKRGKNYLKNLARFDVIFRSPGVPYNLPELIRVRKAGVKFSSATEIFFEHCPCQIIGITGTKGKGTTSTLLYKILKAAKKDVYLVGNIGTPALDLLPKLKKTSLIVFELSSFQLHDLKQSPHIAVVLDIFPDHQDAHRSLPEYYEAKSSIARNQKRGNCIFYLKNSAQAEKIAKRSAGKKIAVEPKRFRLFEPSALAIPGEHNFKNAVVAASVAQKLGIRKQTIIRAVRNFRGMEHRLEFVRKVMVRQAHYKNKSAIYFYNDSASTNPYTAAAAIHAFPRDPKILIAGGKDKGLDYAPLAKALSAKGGSASGGKNSDTKLVILFGENRRKIARAIRKSGARITIVPNIKTAVTAAFKFAKAHHFRRPAKRGSEPIICIFSPGAASFDQFRDYADRGRAFKKLVKKL